MIGSGATGALAAGAAEPKRGELPNTGDTFPGDGGVGALRKGTL